VSGIELVIVTGIWAKAAEGRQSIDAAIRFFAVGVMRISKNVFRVREKVL
jgi:hypothetical protein